MSKTNILDRISFIIFSALVFLLPIFFLPGTGLSVPVAKGILFSTGIVLSLACWLIARVVDGRIVLPKSKILFWGLILTLAVLASAIFSPTSSSFLGSGFEVGTFGFIALAFVSMLLASIFFSDKKKAIRLYQLLALSFLVTALLSLADIIAGPSSALARFLPVNLVGSWNDLAIFSGLVLSMALISLELPLSFKPNKIFSVILVVVPLFFLAAVNFLSAWIIVGLAAFFIFVWSFVLNRSKSEDGAVRFPTASFTVVLISLVFIIAGGLFGNFLPGVLHIDNTEIRPSLVATFSVAKQVISHSPVFGAGPGRFANVWNLYKPEAVNQSLFWNSDFSYGFGLIPSFVATTGILGALAWILFLVFFLISGFLRSSTKTQIAKSEIFLSFFSTLFLWIFAFTYTPSLPVFALAFIMTGVFIGALSAEKKQNYDISFLKDPRLSFFMILILVALVGGALTGGYLFAKKFAGIVYFQKSAFSPNTKEGIADAEKYLMKAIALSDSDLYYRALSQVYMIKLGSLVREGAPESAKTEVQSALSQAEAAAKAAAAKDQSNYQNWLSLASVYEGIIPFGVQGAYENAKAAVSKAIETNPKNPGLYLRLAKIDAAGKNAAAARTDINKALELKPNYADAIIALSQLDVSEGNIDQAIAEIEMLVNAYPNDNDLASYLEQLKAQAAKPASKEEEKKKK